MRKLFLFLCALTWGVNLHAQYDRKVQNRPYTDLRPFHFGVFVGTHFQDLELNNVGPHTITNDDGTTNDALVTTDQDRWDPGFNVGVLGEFRLSPHFQFRIAPTMYFGARHITFRNLKETMPNGNQREQKQDMKTVYVASAFELIFAAPRSNNHRPYLLGGFSPMINLSNHGNDYLELKRYDMFASVGVGCDFYLQYFKLRPELKFMFGLTNSFNSNHVKNIRDKAMLPYATSIDNAQSKMIVLTFYFE